MDFTQQRLPISKGYDESLNEILSCLTSPRFCTKSWNSVTMSVGNDRHKKKNGIIHVHRTTLDDENLFDIKVHRCNKELCNHQICSQSSIAVCDTNQAYLGLPVKRRRRKRKRKGKAKAAELSKAVTFPAERDTEVACFGPLFQKSPFQGSKKSTRGDSCCGSRRTCCMELKECSQDLRRKPSCILYIYSEGRKRKLSFELEPEIETFLTRALDRIDNYSKYDVNRTHEEELDDDFLLGEVGDRPSLKKSSTKRTRDDKIKESNGSKYSYISTKILDESEEGMKVHRQPGRPSKKLYECHPGACLCCDSSSDDIISKLSNQRTKKQQSTKESRGRSTRKWSKRESKKIKLSNKSKNYGKKSKDSIRSRVEFKGDISDDSGYERKSSVRNSISNFFDLNIRPSRRKSSKVKQRSSIESKRENNGSIKIMEKKSTSSKLRQSDQNLLEKKEKPTKKCKRKKFVCHPGICGCCESSSEDIPKFARESRPSSRRRTSRIVSKHSDSIDKSASISRSSSRVSNFFENLKSKMRGSSRDSRRSSSIQRKSTLSKKSTRDPKSFLRKSSTTSFVKLRKSDLNAQSGMLDKTVRGSTRMSSKEDKSDSKKSRYRRIERERSSVLQKPGLSKFSDQKTVKETTRGSYDMTPYSIRDSSVSIHFPRVTTEQKEIRPHGSEGTSVNKSAEAIIGRSSRPYIEENTTYLETVCEEGGFDCNPATCGCCSCQRHSGNMKSTASQAREVSFHFGSKNQIGKSSDRTDSFQRSSLARTSTDPQLNHITDQELSSLNDDLPRISSVRTSRKSRLIEEGIPDQEPNNLNDSIYRRSTASQVMHGRIDDQQQSYLNDSFPRISSIRTSRKSRLIEEGIADQEPNNLNDSVYRRSTASQGKHGRIDDQQQSYLNDSFPRISSIRTSRKSRLIEEGIADQEPNNLNDSVYRRSTASQGKHGRINDQQQGYLNDSFPRTSSIRTSRKSQLIEEGIAHQEPNNLNDSIYKRSTASQGMHGTINDQQQSYFNDSFPRTSSIRTSRASNLIQGDVPDQISNKLSNNFRNSSLVRTSISPYLFEESIPNRAQSQLVAEPNDDNLETSRFVQSPIDTSTSSTRTSVSFGFNGQQPVYTQLDRESIEGGNDHQLMIIPQSASIQRNSTALSDNRIPSSSGSEFFSARQSVDRKSVPFDQSDFQETAVEANVPLRKPTCCSPDGQGVVGGSYTVGCKCMPSQRFSQNTSTTVRRSVLGQGVNCIETISCSPYASGIVIAPDNSLMCFCPKHPQNQTSVRNSLGTPVTLFYSLTERTDHKDSSPCAYIARNENIPQNAGLSSCNEASGLITRNDISESNRNPSVGRSESFIPAGKLSNNGNPSFSNNIHRFTTNLQPDNTEKPKSDQPECCPSRNDSSRLKFDGCYLPSVTLYSEKVGNPTEVYQTFEDSSISSLSKDREPILEDKQVSLNSKVEHYVGYLESRTNSPFQPKDTYIEREINGIENEDNDCVNVDDNVKVIVKDPSKEFVRTNIEDHNNITAAITYSETETSVTKMTKKNYNNSLDPLNGRNLDFIRNFSDEHNNKDELNQCVESINKKIKKYKNEKCDFKAPNSPNLHKTIAHAEVDEEVYDTPTKKRSDLINITIAIATKSDEEDKIRSERKYENNNNTNRSKAENKVKIVDGSKAMIRRNEFRRNCLQKGICSLPEMNCDKTGKDETEKSKSETWARERLVRNRNKIALMDDYSFCQCKRNSCGTNYDRKKSNQRHGYVRHSTPVTRRFDGDKQSKGRFHFRPGDFPKNSQVANNLLIKEFGVGLKNYDASFADCPGEKHLFNFRKKEKKLLKFKDPLVDPKTGFCPRIFV